MLLPWRCQTAPLVALALYANPAREPHHEGYRAPRPAVSGVPAVLLLGFVRDTPQPNRPGDRSDLSRHFFPLSAVGPIAPAGPHPDPILALLVCAPPRPF